MSKTLVSKRGRARQSSMPEGVLLPQHEHFCQLIAEGYSGAQAYRDAVATGYVDRITAQTGASRLRSDEKIAARIRELSVDFKTFMTEKLGLSRESFARKLTDILEVSPSELNIHNPLATKVTYNDHGGVKSIEGISKEKALDLLAKLGGYAEPEQVNVNVNTTEEVRAALGLLFSKDKE